MPAKYKFALATDGIPALKKFGLDLVPPPCAPLKSQVVVTRKTIVGQLASSWVCACAACAIRPHWHRRTLAEAFAQQHEPHRQPVEHAAEPAAGLARPGSACGFRNRGLPGWLLSGDLLRAYYARLVALPSFLPPCSLLNSIATRRGCSPQAHRGRGLRRFWRATSSRSFCDLPYPRGRITLDTHFIHQAEA